MDQKLTGINILAYRGVNPTSPPQLVIHQRAPVASDYRNFEIGTIWLNNAGIYLTPPVKPTNTDIYMLVSVSKHIAKWVFFGVPVPPPDTFTGDTGLAVGPDAALNINMLSGIDGLWINGDPPINTMILNNDTGYPLLQSISDDSGVKIYPDASGDVDIFGTAGHIVTTGSIVGNNIAFDLDTSISTDFTSNDGNIASPVLGNLNVFGNNNIYTSVPAGNTLDIAVHGTTNHSLQLGNATGSLTSLGIANDGEIPIGVTGSDPVLKTLTGGTDITITNGPGSIIVANDAVIPAWHVYIQAALIPNVTGDVYGKYQVMYDGILVDTTNSYDIARGAYIIPRTGLYFIGFNGSLQSNPAIYTGSSVWAIIVYRNFDTQSFAGAIITQGGSQLTKNKVTNYYGPNGGIDQYLSGIISCTAGDRITTTIDAPGTLVNLKVDGVLGSNGIPGTGTAFCGYFIGDK